MVIGSGIEGAIVDSQRLNPDMVNLTEANLRGRHPQLATFGVIPCANDKMALEYCEGIIPERGKIIAIAEAIGNNLFPMDGIL